MAKGTAPQTVIDEIKISIQEVMHLSVKDSVRDVMQKGLYTAPEDSIVIVFDGATAVVVATADRLRGQVLPRSWRGQLGEWVGHLAPPPEVMAHTRVAELDFFVQDIPDIDWLLVVEEETGAPVGVLDRNRVLDFLPPPDTVTEVYRAAHTRLWGDSSVQHVYYYCPIEKRYYGPHAVRPGPDGVMRDRDGHQVTKREPPEK